MMLVTGAAHAGKTAWVRQKLSPQALCDGQTCTPEEALTAACITQYHALVRRLIAEHADPLAFTERLCRENPDCIVLLDEIGCGIIPLDRADRLWREQTGRCGCLLAESAQTVVRICCGIPSAIKGELP